MATRYTPRIVTDGLVLCLDAANSKSYPGTGTAWTDLSRNGRNGTLTNGPTFNSANGGSIVFDGTNDRVEIGSSAFTFNGGTAEIWTKLTSNNRNQGFLGIQFGTPGNTYINFWMSTNNLMRWEVIGNSSLTYLAINSTTAFTTGTWYHVVGTFDGITNRIYINGNPETSSTTGGSNVPTNFTTVVALGDYSSSGSYPLAGNIALANVYTRALTQSEILQNFNATKGRFGL